MALTDEAGNLLDIDLTDPTIPGMNTEPGSLTTETDPNAEPEASPDTEHITMGGANITAADLAPGTIIRARGNEPERDNSLAIYMAVLNNDTGELEIIGEPDENGNSLRMPLAQWLNMMNTSNPSLDVIAPPDDYDGTGWSSVTSPTQNTRLYEDLSAQEQAEIADLLRSPVDADLQRALHMLGHDFTGPNSNPSLIDGITGPNTTASALAMLEANPDLREYLHPSHIHDFGRHTRDRGAFDDLFPDYEPPDSGFDAIPPSGPGGHISPDARQQAVLDTYEHAAEVAGISPILMRGVWGIESAYGTHPTLVSHGNARGDWQFLDGTFNEVIARHGDLIAELAGDSITEQEAAALRAGNREISNAEWGATLQFHPVVSTYAAALYLRQNADYIGVDPQDPNNFGIIYAGYNSGMGNADKLMDMARAGDMRPAGPIIGRPADYNPAFYAHGANAAQVIANYNSYVERYINDFNSLFQERPDLGPVMVDNGTSPDDIQFSVIGDSIMVGFSWHDDVATVIAQGGNSIYDYSIPDNLNSGIIFSSGLNEIGDNQQAAQQHFAALQPAVMEILQQGGTPLVYVHPSNNHVSDTGAMDWHMEAVNNWFEELRNQGYPVTSITRDPDSADNVHSSGSQYIADADRAIQAGREIYGDMLTRLEENNEQVVASNGSPEDAGPPLTSLVPRDHFNDVRGSVDPSNPHLASANIILGRPLDEQYPLTSEFGPRNGRNHNGTDYGAPIGTPIHATSLGQVSSVNTNVQGYGDYMTVYHGDAGHYQIFTGYAHLSGFNAQVGDVIEPGEVIAYTGNTGRSTGPHLDYTVLVRTPDGTFHALDPEATHGRNLSDPGVVESLMADAVSKTHPNDDNIVGTSWRVAGLVEQLDNGNNPIQGARELAAMELARAEQVRLMAEARSEAEAEAENTAPQVSELSGHVTADPTREMPTVGG